MALIRVIKSSRVDLEHSDFLVEVLEGAVSVGELIEYKDDQSRWEFVVQQLEGSPPLLRVRCANWLLRDGHLNGAEVTTRALKAKERKRYSRVLNGA